MGGGDDKDKRRHDLRGEGPWPDDDFTTWEESLSWQRTEEGAFRRAGGSPEVVPSEEEVDEAWPRWARRLARLPRRASAGSEVPPPDDTGSRPAPPPTPVSTRRRRATAGATLLAMLLGFFFAGLLDAGTIKKDIEGQPLGRLRTVQLALLSPMVALSGALSFDAPAHAINAALGRDKTAHHTLADVTPAETPHWPRTITQAQPLRLLILGDSMAMSLGPYVKNTAERQKTFKARVSYKVSSGLSRPDFFDWPQYMVDLIVEFNPDATVVFLGANDGQDFRYKGKIVEVGMPGWQEGYQARVAKSMKTLTRNGRRVYWVGMPVMRDPVHNESMKLVNKLSETEAQKHPGVQFISTWDLFAGPNGGYAEYLKDEKGRPRLMRTSDGSHLTEAGAALATDYILAIVERDWSMASAAASPQAGASPGPSPSP